MDLLLMITTVLVGLMVFGVVATFFGADSRDSIGDDWGRPIRV
jgi:hypothetical protein